MIKLSIVIPVWNSKKYLKECLDSILNQRMPSCEIILVDDCSTDGSEEICNYYAKKYENISYIKNEVNKGPGYCRNVGLRNAVGEYLYFMDSDDFLVEKSFDEIFPLLDNGIDMIYLNDQVVSESGEVLIENPSANAGSKQLLTREKFITFLENKGSILPSAWRVIIKNNIIKSNKIYFLEDYLAEEFSFIIGAILHSQKICTMESKTYCYRDNSEHSLTVNLDNNRAKKATVKAIVNLYDIYENLLGFNSFLNLLKNNIKNLFWLLGFLIIMGKEETLILENEDRFNFIIRKIYEESSNEEFFIEFIKTEGFINGVVSYFRTFYDEIEKASKENKNIIVVPASKRNGQLCKRIEGNCKVSLFDNKLKSKKYGKYNIVKDIHSIDPEKVRIIICHNKETVRKELVSQFQKFDYFLI